MNIAEVEELLFFLKGEMAHYSYFQDRYAFQFLAWTLETHGEKSVGQLKQHAFGKFLNKPLLKKLSGKNSKWSAELLQMQWPETCRNYEITFDKWGNHKEWSRYWNQSCRKGSNLVLQLNFSEDHDLAQHKFKSGWGWLDNNYACHPVRKGGRHTLSWSRIDIDWETEEALIEEIQSDWITSLLDSRKMYQNIKNGRSRYQKKLTKNEEKLIEILASYLESLRFEVKHWPEITLAATIDLLRNQLGIKKIWYHTPESGALVKRLGTDGVPRSHYKDLPRRFGFQRKQEWPEFIRKNWGTRRKKIQEKCEAMEWNYLELD